MYKLSCREMQILSCTINRKNGRGIERKKFLFYSSWKEREREREQKCKKKKTLASCLCNNSVKDLNIEKPTR